MPEIATRDATLHCEVDGDGTPVTVVAHGLTNNRSELAAFMPFVPGTKVRFDFRGHGRTATSPDAMFTFRDFADDVDAVARAFAATVAVGTSLGAGAIANLVCREPERFERMVWLLPAGLDGPFAHSARYHALADRLRLEGGAAIEELLSDPARVTEEIATPWRVATEHATWEHDDLDALSRAIHGVVADHPVPDRELLRRVTSPTLILTIDGDEIHPAELGRIYADLMPNAELLAFAGQHDLAARLPEVVGRVTAFIAGA